jgi:hypothetical protein
MGGVELITTAATSPRAYDEFQVATDIVMFYVFVYLSLRGVIKKGGYLWAHRGLTSTFLLVESIQELLRRECDPLMACRKIV